MKGIVLAGGAGTRLYPATIAFSKQLLPIYGKPLIYYPLSVLMLAGIREIAIITTPDDQPLFQKLLGNGDKYGITLEYIAQPKPEGIAQAFLLAEQFIGEEDVALILGDNIFYGQSFTRTLQQAIEIVEQKQEAVIFSYQVKDPERFGVVEFDAKHRAISIEEKPKQPKSHFAVVGLYFYPNDVIQQTKSIRPSTRGELEITSVNQCYLAAQRLTVQPLGRGFAWLDTGTHESLYDAGDFIRTIERRQGLQVANLEEIAYQKGWITDTDIEQIITAYSGSDYAQYLRQLLRH